MSQTTKVVLGLIGLLIAAYVVLQLVGFVVGIVKLLLPIAVLGGIGYGIYYLVSRNNALPGGRRYLP
ncbi:MAG TPA: hypothetical protein VMI31_11990 [Fimbriimonadaceae bacterium]|nr:hypothetical protein [Fimbriimonadaceae bacterium]